MSDPQVHPSAILGPQVVVAPDAAVGANCVLDGRTTVGARATLAVGVTLLHDAEVGADCRLEANVSTTAGPTETVRLALGKGSRIGAGAVLTGGVQIGADAWIEPGSVVVRDVPAHGIVRGNPGVVVGFRDSPSRRVSDVLAAGLDGKAAGVVDCEVAGVKLFRFPHIVDLRGSLTFGEFGHVIPFEPKRYFMVYDVPPDELRGGHAHATCKELIQCIGGSVAVVVDDGRVRREFVLDRPDNALFLPSRVWGIQYKYSPGAVLVVLASHHYDPGDYIHSYDDFTARIEAGA